MSLETPYKATSVGFVGKGQMNEPKKHPTNLAH